MPVGQTYSDRYQLQGQKDDMEDVSAEYLNQQATRNRVRLFSAETNRRRKALEQKKKLEAQKEAKRRTEVLEERRKRQQEATTRYQRLCSRASPKKTRSRQDAVYSGPRLQEGVRMAKGYKINATPDKPSPSMEDVLKMVGHQGNPSSPGYAQPQITSEQRDDHSGYRSKQQNREEVSSLDRNANTVKRGPDNTYHHKYHGYTTAATPIHGSHVAPVVERGPENMYHQKYHGYTTAASPIHGSPAAPVVEHHQPTDIQQDLVDQQRVFIEQQKKSLMEFNQALLRESSSKNVDLDCSSVSSQDSLEACKKPISRELTFDGDEDSLDGINQVCHGGGSIVSGSNFQSQGNSVQSLTSQFQSQHHQENSKNIQKVHQPVDKNVSMTSYIGNGQFLLGLPSSEGYPYHKQDQVQNTFNYSQTDSVQNESYSKNNNFNGSYSQTALTTHVNNSQNRPSHAWDHSVSKPEKTAPSKGSSPQVTGYQTSQKQYSDSKTRGFSAKTSATPIFTSGPLNDKLTKKMKKNEKGEAVGDATTKYNSPYRLENVAGGKKIEDSNSNLDILSPKSILKRISKYPTAPHEVDNPSPKWGKNELRDSMDIASATQVKRTLSKKSVRWTDLIQSESDNSQIYAQNGKTVDFQDKFMMTENPKPPVTNARIVQQKLTASNDMEEANVKSPVLLSRNTFRSKFGSQNGKSASEVQSKMETKYLQSRHDSTPTGKPPSGKYQTPKYIPKRMNGFTLNKTPTDDEINQLWDKVRTCLHSREGSPDPRSSEAQQMRRAASDQSLAESSQRLTANLRIVSANQGPEPNQNKVKKYHTVPRWRTCSDSGTSVSKRVTLVQRQEDAQRKRITSAESRIRNPPAPITSHVAPNRSTGSNRQVEVNDSLMAFQQAEMLAQQNFSEAEIEDALDHQGSDHLHQTRGPSCLSLEEHRILESLDRLNEKLRITSDVSTNYSAMTPRPPAYGSGFRPHRPLSSKPYGTNNKGRAGLRVRSSSADRDNSRIWNYR